MLGDASQAIKKTGFESRTRLAESRGLSLGLCLEQDVITPVVACCRNDGLELTGTNAGSWRNYGRRRESNHSVHDENLVGEAELSGVHVEVRTYRVDRQGGVCERREIATGVSVPC